MGGTRDVGVDMAPRGLRGKLFLFDKRRQPLVYTSLKLSLGGRGGGGQRREHRGAF